VVKLIKLHFYITIMLYCFKTLCQKSFNFKCNSSWAFHATVLEVPNDHKHPSIFYLHVYDAFSFAEYCHMITDNVFGGGIYLQHAVMSQVLIRPDNLFPVHDVFGNAIRFCGVFAHLPCLLTGTKNFRIFYR
jgi:hypothetical protein